MGDVSDEQLWSWLDRDAPELDEHLQQHPDDEERVEKMRAIIDGVASASGQAPLPETIGRYRINDVLGTGAMGVVYEAVQENPKRTVALKVVHGALKTDPQILRYFHREAQLLGRLSHPAIATVYEAGTTEAGEPFLAMQLAKGRTLSRYLTEENPDRRTRLRVLQRIASAVHVAHESGVIHRDLKPSNIFVDEGGSPMVLDFGLARLAQPEAGSLWSHGSSRHLVGTLQYMSPEQAFGRVEEVDRRTDVYALGVLLYEALLGERPYEVQGQSLPDALERIKTALPGWTPAQRRDVGPDLQAIVLHALEKAPAHRYPTAAALADDIARFLDGKSIEARTPSVGRRMGRVVRRHKALAFALGLGVVALGLGLWLGGGADEPVSPGVDLQSPLVGDRGGPERSPFQEVRWDGDTPTVLHDGRWYEVESLAGHRLGLILEFCKQAGGARWRVHFREDLIQVLERMGTTPGETITLRLWDVEAGETIEVRAPMTEALRGQAGSASIRSAYADFRCPEDVPEVKFEGRWYRLRALEGIPIADLRRQAEQYDNASWKRFLIVSQVDLLTDIRGQSPGETVLLELIDLETGEERLVSDAPFTFDLATVLFEVTEDRPERTR